MAYVVLARKYRPQRFADLVGQEHVTKTLANAISHDRVHHAYLFCGARGLGKTSAARILAKCLVCERGPAIEPCNECRECTAVTDGSSVDVIEIDGASNNRVDDIRNLREQVRYLPQTARKKIYIVDEVHMLTGSAFNALLKTLEEPPPHVTFILATTEVHELPATILSRVSRFDFRRVASGQLVAHISHLLEQEGVQIEEAGLYTIARAGDGSVRDTLTLLDKIIAFASDTRAVSEREVRTVLGVPARIAVAELTDAVLARDAEQTLRLFDEVVESGQDLQQLALALLQHLRDLLVVKVCGARDVVRDMSDSQFEHLRAQADSCAPVVLSQLFDRFARTVDALPRTRVPRLIMEMGLLDLVHSDPLMPLGDLIERLDELAAGRGGGSRGGSRGGGYGISRDTSQRAPQPRPSRPPRQDFEGAPAQAHSAPARAPESAPRGDRSNANKERLRRILEGARPPGAPAQAARHAPPSEPANAGAPAHARHPRPPSRPAAAEDEPPAEPGTRAAQRASPSPRRAPDLGTWTETPEFSTWESFLTGVAERDTPLTAMLMDCGVFAFSPARVHLATPPGDMRRRQLKPGSEMFTTLQRALATFFQRDGTSADPAIDLEFQEQAPTLPDLPSLTLVRSFRARELQMQVEREANAAPEIRRLVADFDGTVHSVKPLGSA